MSHKRIGLALSLVLAMSGCARLAIRTEVFDSTDLELEQTTAQAAFQAMALQMYRQQREIDQLVETTFPALFQELDDLLLQCASDSAGRIISAQADNLIRLRQSATESMNEGLQEIRQAGEDVADNLAFNIAWNQDEINERRRQVAAAARRQTNSVMALAGGMRDAVQFFTDNCRNLSDDERAATGKTAEEFAQIDNRLVEMRRNVAARGEESIDASQAIEAIALEPAVVTPTDPNLRILSKPEYADRWHAGFSESESFGAFGKGHQVIVQNSLVDYRVKTVTNDITQAVTAMRSAIDEVVRTAAGIYGVSASAQQSGTNEAAQDTEGLSDIQTDQRLADARRSELLRLRQSLSTFIEPRVRAYETSGEAAVQQRILAEIRGRIRDTVNRLQVTTDAAQEGNP